MYMYNNKKIDNEFQYAAGDYDRYIHSLMNGIWYFNI